MLLFGALFSLFVPRDFHKPVFTNTYFWHGVIFASIFNAGVAYAIATYPDWMWMYFLEDSRNSPFELIYLFVFLYYLPYTLGFYLGLDLKRRSRASWVAFAVFLLVSEAWLIARLFNRYTAVGTRAEFLNGTAKSLLSPDNPLGPALNGSVALMILYFGFVFYRYRKSCKA
jgi:hypothetical protein